MAEQLSVVVALQLAHMPPFTPQADIECARQVLPAQHPEAHEVPSHTHAPPTQRCPGAQAAPLPHRHVPLVEQLSAKVAPHATHAEPAFPQVVVERAMQVLPEQQPEGHDVPSHTQAPPTQRCPDAHTGPVPH